MSWEKLITNSKNSFLINLLIMIIIYMIIIISIDLKILNKEIIIKINNMLIYFMNFKKKKNF
jgi:hypothetical protein